MKPLIIEVPSPLGLRPDGVQAAPGALRTAGLHARLGSPDAACIEIPPYCDVRDPGTGVLNPRGVAAVAQGLAAAVDTALDSGRFLEVTIFNPRLDPGGGLARRLRDLIANVMRPAAWGQQRPHPLSEEGGPGQHPG